MIFNKHNLLFKRTAIVLCLSLLWQIIFPLTAYGLTGGPSQPEVQSFEPVGTTDMVDPFTGDFNYNIPLLDIEGYPINISYHSGITADQEASWTGLGWNINPGAISRELRGLPDDFKGDTIKKKFHIKPDITVGANLGVKFELIGFDAVYFSKIAGLSLGYNLGVFNNSYRGMGYEFGITPSLSIGDKVKGHLNVNIGYNSQAGYTVNSSLGVSAYKKEGEEKSELSSASASVSAGYNSRGGLKSLSFGTNASIQEISKFSKSANWSTSMFSDDRSASLSFGSPTYTPTISMPMKNFGLTVSGAIGLEFFLLHPGITITGYYSKSRLATDSVKRQCYGYLNLQNASSDTSLTDFNREKDAGFTREMAKLSVPQLTYDIFNVAGHGVGGSFRAFRNDLGIVGDDRNTNLSTNTNLGLEVGLGNILHAGADLRRVHVNTIGGKWNEFNTLDFASINTYDASYEPSYFKNAGEMVRGNTEVYNRFGTNDPVYLKLSAGGGDIYSTGQIVNDKGATLKVPASQRRNGTSTRQVRNAVMSYISAKQGYAALDKDINYFNINQQPDANGHLIAPTGNKIVRNAGKRKPHHISEVTVNNPDGGRYVYGIPTYNNIQREITYGSADGAGANCVSGHVHYTKDGSGNIIPLGGSEFYSENVTPGYAYSYLLTGVLSDDYVDASGDGISQDDIGTAVKFNYSKTQSNYRWRVPVNQDSASYNAGHYSDIYDDKGSIIYGDKEMWYLHSIETKNYVALFKISKRDDALGVLGVHGGKDTTCRMYKLDSIVLYAKFNGQINKTPIKTVKFIYDYSLCQGIDNAKGSNGKLTLKQIIFTYGNSQKGYRNRYRFTYQNNYSYHLKNYDRWGNYLKYGINSGCVPDSLYPSEAPYTPQNRTLEDNYSSAWTLSQIELPSGGSIKVNYEADDYAYVQDKKAGQMFPIAGFGSSTNFSSSNNLYGSDGSPNQYIFFKLQNSTADNATATMRRLDHYLKKVGWLYYNAFVKILKGPNDKYDYIRGYLSTAGIYGIAADNAGYGYIKVNMVPIGDNSGSDRKIHPISKSALQFMRLEVPHLIFPASAPDGGSANESGIDGVLGALHELNILRKGFNTYCLGNGDAKEVMLNKSFIRLNAPYGHKLGGGSRVKSILFYDNWEQMSGRTGTSQITQGLTYDYNLPKETEANPDGTPISSGVASWEPEIGGDENPFRQPVFYTVKNKLALDNEFFQEEPYGESLMPAPSVGYRYVKVTQISPSNVGIRGTGYTVSEFYTAKDFPTKLKSTAIQKMDNINSPGGVIRQFLGLGVKEYVGASQGYSIELNDMHGKPKSKFTYRVKADNKAEIVSGAYYQYQTDDNDPTQLSNTVKVITPAGTVTSQEIGVNMDMNIDMRKQVTDNTTSTLGIGLDNTVMWVIPMIIPHAWPMPVTETSTFKSAVMAKVVRRNAILKRTWAVKEGSYISTDNEAWDSETGEVLLSSTTNEFRDTLYSMNYPAHWLLDTKMMGQSYKNIGAQGSSGSLSSIFQNGDEVWIANSDGSSPQQGWYYSGVIKDKDGASITSFSGKTLFVYRSGYRNKASMPVFQMSSKKIPVVSNIVKPSTTSEIIDAKGVYYSNSWYGQCERSTSATCFDVSDTAKQFYQLLEWLKSKDSLCMSPGDSVYLYDPYNSSVGPSWYSSSHLYSMTKSGYSNNKQYLKCFTSTVTGQITYGFVLESNGVHGYQFTFNAILQSLSHADCGAITRLSGIAAGNSVGAARVYAYQGSTLLCLDLFVDGSLCRCYNAHLFGSGMSNGFYSGALGNYRKRQEYYYPTTRKQSVPVSSRNDGTWDNFSPLYSFYNSGGTYQGDLRVVTGNPWLSKMLVTHYASNGQELENKDALGIYSAARFAFNKTMPVAVAHNSRYLQTGVFSCDADVDRKLPDGARSYWKFLKANGSLADFDSLVSHTGIRSIKLSAGDSVQAYVGTDGDSAYEVGGTTPFCNDDFYPTAGKYLISGWVKVDTTAKADNYTRPYIKVFSNDTSSVQKLYPSGPIIEGWQRISDSAYFKVCPSPYYVRLMADPNFPTHFDDIRVHPYDALMNAYVYDPITLRLMSTLDENNYATFYEYDEEGNLVRTKRETEKGVMTVKENRQSVKKMGN